MKSLIYDLNSDRCFWGLLMNGIIMNTFENESVNILFDLRLSKQRICYCYHSNVLITLISGFSNILLHSRSSLITNITNSNIDAE